MALEMLGALAIRFFLVLGVGGVLAARIDHTYAGVEGPAIEESLGRLNVSGTGTIGSHTAFVIPDWVITQLIHHGIEQADEKGWEAIADAAHNQVGLNLAAQTYLEVSIAFGLFAGQFTSIRAQMQHFGEFPELSDQWYLGVHYTAQQHMNNDQSTMERVADMAYVYYEAAKIRKDIPQMLLVQHQHNMQAAVDARLPVLKQHLESLSGANSAPMLARVARKALAVARMDIQLNTRNSTTMMMQTIEANTDDPLQINESDLSLGNPWRGLRFTHLSRIAPSQLPLDNGGPFRVKQKLEKWTARNRWTLRVGQGEAGQRNESAWLVWSHEGATADQLSIDGGWNWLKWSGWCGPLGSFISQDLHTIVEVSTAGA